ncbi:MAG: 1-deoxy-D-xylulose-5-phosphate reductoisomerase [Actinobacteria bacterium]|nr:MAG: 1-deoxy-D-xylulose-5-phosphate reductoisomerase [Actinomycetota bacterium]
MKRISILGSTGSIGTQALDVIRKHRNEFEVVALVAGRNAELLAEQVDEFAPALAVLADAVPPAGSYFSTGAEAVVEAATYKGCDLVLNALVGSRGLLPTLAALDAGKTVAPANKESLIAGGDLVTRKVRHAPERLLPVDSEHSALFQCLAGNRLSDVRRVIVTASGGPFRGRTYEELSAVGVEEALAHPTWRMGRKITVDSATLMNKGLEAIEAHHLFGIPMDRVEVVVHPQSIVHGIVEFHDGSCILQAANADMRLPIQVALAWPDRLPEGAEPLEWSSLGSLDFEPVDRSTFRCLDIAFEAARKGVTYPAVMNAANEEAVGAFLDERLAFTGIPSIVEDVLAAHKAAPELTLEAVLDAEQWARAEARSRIEACS